MFADTDYAIGLATILQSRAVRVWKPEFDSRIGHHVTESSGARVMYDGVVSSGSPADIAHVPRKDAQIYSHSKTIMYYFV